MALRQQKTIPDEVGLYNFDSSFLKQYTMEWSVLDACVDASSIISFRFSCSIKNVGIISINDQF